MEIDPVLKADPPRFSEAQAAELGAQHFGLAADGAVNLGSERDQTFLLTRAGGPVGVLKVSNAAEDPATLDMEALVVRHIGRVDPELPVARPLAHGGAEDLDDAPAYRVEVARDSARHWARAYPVMPGRMRSEPAELDRPRGGRLGRDGGAAGAGRCAASATPAPHGRCRGTSGRCR